MKECNHSLVLSGDGRADSPGHSAKYGSYTVLEMSCNEVIHFSLVQVSQLHLQSNEVGGSYHMEKEGATEMILYY